METAEILPLGHAYSNGICKTCRLPEGLQIELSEGTYQVVGYTGNLTVLVIPEAVDGIPVTAVKAGAFAENSVLKTVYLPASVLVVGEGVFVGCTALSEILCGRAFAPASWHENWAWGSGGTISWSQEPPASKKILYGDVNGDGKISAIDYGLLKRYVLQTYQLTPEGLLAADASGDGKISALDYVRVKGHVLGIDQIDQDR